jgi:hypothetical protein
MDFASSPLNNTNPLCRNLSCDGILHQNCCKEVFADTNDY